MSKKFRYIKVDFFAFETEKILNQCGDDGWDLISIQDVVPEGNHGHMYTAILKKEVDQQV